jgi:hypothetical protein
MLLKMKTGRNYETRSQRNRVEKVPFDAMLSSFLLHLMQRDILFYTF